MFLAFVRSLGAPAKKAGLELPDGVAGGVHGEVAPALEDVVHIAEVVPQVRGGPGTTKEVRVRPVASEGGKVPVPARDGVPPPR